MNRSMSYLSASLLTATSFLSAASLHGQSAAPAAGAAATMPAPPAGIVPPMLPLVTNYRYWPVQFVQFVGTELPYAMIELDVDPGVGKQPLLYVTLTDRASGKRIHYTPDAGLLASAAGVGEEAHKAAIAYEAADTESPGSISTVRLTMADGKPLEWRFVQGSELSEQGSGLNPFPEAKIPIFAYREQGALAGEGTALKIGETVSTAAVWTEYSHPPYFIPYRGALTESAHTLVFTPGQQSWSVVSAPGALTAGATWELDGAQGDHRTIRIDKADGTHLTVTSTDRFQPGVRCTLDVTRAGDGWSVERARFAPVRDGEKHGLTLAFATPLAMGTDRTEMTLLAGKKKTIASGAVASGTGGGLTLSFGNPAWLNGKSMTEDMVAAAGTVSLSAHP